MIVIGLILLLLGAGLAGAAIMASYDESGLIRLSFLTFERDTRPIELIGLGLVAALLFCLGWACIAAAARRSSRQRREDRDAERVADIERTAETQRAESEARFEQAGLRDEDLRRRESDLDAWSRTLDAREADVVKREEQWRQQAGPSVADVVTGRAGGNVHEGTAEWSDQRRDADGDRVPDRDGDRDADAVPDRKTDRDADGVTDRDNDLDNDRAFHSGKGQRSR